MAPKSKDSAPVVLKKNGKAIEVLVVPGSVQAWRELDAAPLADVLFADTIWADASRGEAASDALIAAVVGDVDADSALREVLMKGEVRLTAAQRKAAREDLRRRLLGRIHEECVSLLLAHFPEARRPYLGPNAAPARQAGNSKVAQTASCTLP